MIIIRIYTKISTGCKLVLFIYLFVGVVDVGGGGLRAVRCFFKAIFHFN